MLFKRLYKIIIITFIFALTTFVGLYNHSLIKTYVTAQEESNQNQDAITETEKEIKELEEKLSKKQNEAASLQGELGTLDNQISLTQAQIQNSQAKIINTQDQIDKLIQEIDDIKNRISKLSDSIDYQKDLLNIRMRERYKSRDINPFLALFGSDTFNALVQKAEYLQQIEIQDNKLLNEMESTKNSYDNQKNIFEDKKQEEEDLKQKLVQEKANLDNYSSQLNNQKYEKQKLLEITKNQESVYAQMLADAKRELQQISGAVSVLKNQSGERVERGDLIGYQGNTGYSFGEHLHFGIYKYKSFNEIDGWSWYYNNYVNPKEVLERKNLYWNTGCESPGYKETGNGDWKWPINNPVISQGFGYTCWSNRFYGGKPHPAYDMYGSYGAPVYATEDGEAYFCRNCLNDGGNGVFIFHDNGYMSLYWHLR